MAVELALLPQAEMLGRFFLMCGFAAAAAVAATAARAAPIAPDKDASASVSIGVAASFRKLQNLDFGSLAITGAGTVTINPNTEALTFTGGILQIGGRPYAAKFETISPRKSKVLIKAPNKPITLTRQGGTETMIVSNFTISGSSSRNVNSGEPIEFSIGGTLSVKAGQAEGTYVGTFDVDVNYN
jgi:hypothetical protein